MTVHLVDCDYTGREGYAAAYVVPHADGMYVVEANTRFAVPRILAAVADAGAAPADVTHLVVTHVHLDHAGGAGALLAACPNARVIAHPRAAPHLIDPSRLVAAATAVYGAARFAELYGAIDPIDAARVDVAADDAELRIGGHALRVLHTRGHANHHLCLVDADADAVFTGDSFGVRYPSVGPRLAPSTSPSDFDADAAVASAWRIASCGASAAWLTHFGAVTDLAAAAAELEAGLRAHAAIADAARGLSGAALNAFCAERVDAWFAEHFDGLPADLLALDRDLNAMGLAAAVTRAARR